MPVYTAEEKSDRDEEKAPRKKRSCKRDLTGRHCTLPCWTWNLRRKMDDEITYHRRKKTSRKFHERISDRPRPASYWHNWFPGKHDLATSGPRFAHFPPRRRDADNPTCAQPIQCYHTRKSKILKTNVLFVDRKNSCTSSF